MRHSPDSAVALAGPAARPNIFAAPPQAQAEAPRESRRRVQRPFDAGAACAGEDISFIVDVKTLGRARTSRWTRRGQIVVALVLALCGLAGVLLPWDGREAVDGVTEVASGAGGRLAERPQVPAVELRSNAREVAPARRLAAAARHAATSRKSPDDSRRRTRPRVREAPPRPASADRQVRPRARDVAPAPAPQAAPAPAARDASSTPAPAPQPSAPSTSAPPVRPAPVPAGSPPEFL